ncbi:MAG TPA: isocitrate/isopropylmalate dehydrogenase family protein [Candidatus Eisenbacteria bacterium]|nr:isocitrate/isopropylmalate dehydrogenase family protein [Candidatus Eisenbacteria bacterium]
MSHAVTLIPGDGIGPELMRAARRAIEATGVAIAWDLQPAGADQIATEGTPLPQRVIDSLRRTGVGLKGPLTTPIGTGFRSVNVTLRATLDLYANVRPARTFPGIRNAVPGVDLVIVRENTEDLYAGIEFERGSPALDALRALVQRTTGQTIRADAAVSLKPISELGSRRIVRFAFEYARANGRRRVTAVHKANIMKATDGLFLAVAREEAAHHPDIAFDEAIVDALCMRLVQRPQEFDVLVLPNLYGDIVSDLAAGLVGGLGVAPGANLGADIAVFEPVHGSAPQFAGLGLMNPMALMLSGAMMLHHLGESDAAARLERAVARVLADGRAVTRDVKAPGEESLAVGTEAMTDAVVAAMTQPDALAARAQVG